MRLNSRSTWVFTVVNEQVSHPRVSRIDDDETYVHQSDGDGELVTDCNSMMTTN